MVEAVQLPPAPLPSKKRPVVMAKKVVLTIGKWIGRAWKGLSYSIGSMILFLVILGLVSGLALPATPSFSGFGVNERVIEGEGPNKIALVKLSGLILTESTPVSPLGGGVRAITPDRVRRLLDRASSDANVKGVILFIDSPGGSAVASDMVFEEIMKFKKETQKPVVVQMGDTVASGGYFISAAADRIIASKASLTGSIGVIAKLYNLSELYAKIGVRPETFKKGEYKDILSEARERTEEEKAMLDQILEDAYQLFLNQVAQGRAVATGEEWPVAKVEDLANGKIYSGQGAVEVGLVDQIGNLVDAVEVAKTLAGIEEAQVVEYVGGSLIEQLFGGMSVLGRLFGGMLDPTPRVMYLLEI
jgi:protease-4